MTNKYWKPPVHATRCKRSNPISSMCEVDVMVLSSACGRVLRVLSLMHLQILLTKYSISYIMGQKKRSFINSKVWSYPKCPMSTCNSLNLNGFSLLSCFHHLFCEVSYHYLVLGLGVHAKASWTEMIFLQHLQLSYFSGTLSHLQLLLPNLLISRLPNVISSK